MTQISLKTYYTLWGIKVKNIQNTRIHFMRLGRCCICVMRTRNSTFPMDGSHVSTSPFNFGPTTALVQSLCLCLGSLGHSGKDITISVVSCQVFYLGHNWLKVNIVQRSWEGRHITTMVGISVACCWVWQYQFGYQGGRWFWIQYFEFCA